MAAATMHDPIHPFPDSPMDAEDAAFPCKGCGEILEEGKAFELAGNRWHIDCFRCNTCNTLLDSDANLLLLGDGSLICNNCTYSCSSCGNKIEDLAILTGDQAFCANCFKCRNCKRKIENLRYARTSQGIFCMDCHEALMARRRKKTAKGGSSSKKTAHFDKSLPAIPPPEARHTAYMPPSSQSHSAELPGEEVPMPSNAAAPSVLKTLSELRGDTDSDNSRPATSSHGQQPGLTLPSTTYRDYRQSYTSQRSEMSAGGEEFLIPLAFDPTPAKESPPIHGAAHHHHSPSEDRIRDALTNSSARSHAPSQSTSQTPHVTPSQRTQPNDFSHNRYDSKTMRSDPNATPSHASPDVQQSPHISQLARGESARNESTKASDASKKRGPSISSMTAQDKQAAFGRADSRGPETRPIEEKETPRMAYETSPDFTDGFNSPPQPQIPRPLPQRGDSLGNVAKAVPRKELPSSSLSYPPINENATTPVSKPQAPIDLAKANGGKVISAPISSPGSQSLYDTPELPHEEASTGVKFVQPRAPPAPPAGGHARNESISTLQSDAQPKSPKLPTYAGQGDFTLEEDITRILGLDEPTASESFLRRVSNSVRHGRSYSDRSGRFSRDKWPKSPGMPSGPLEISSPTTASPEHREELAWLKNELRKERQKTIERERKINELETHLNAADEISQVNVELKEKRSTMVVLDTQKEIVVRELEVLTEHIANAKASGQPLDMNKMTSAVLRDLADALDRLKRQFTPQIENLVQQKSDLLDDITQLNQQKDKSFHEFEQLSNKNAQLAEFNNQLVDQIQNIYKSNSGTNLADIKQPSGLGIYAHHKDNSKVSIDDRGARPSISAGGHMHDPGTTFEASEVGSIQAIGGAQVVEMKKGAVAKRFDWRRGQKMAKGITKGVKGAFTSAQQNYNNGMAFAETGAYGAQTPGSEYAPGSRHDQDPKQGWFGNNAGNKQTPNKNGLYPNSANASTPSLVIDGSLPLFGTELKTRAEFEKQPIPGIVKRCIAEVETRGMDVEGIYRKSGGNSQVMQVKDGFEKQPYDYDISDPDLDIHAVTSGLKQYFRKLPTPLITYEVYDLLLELTKIPEGPNQRDQRIQGMQEALSSLPRVHYEILEYLMAHLARVVVLEKENLMTPMNVAVVFAPTIMRPESVARELSDTKAKNEVIMWMVNDGERVFGKS